MKQKVLLLLFWLAAPTLLADSQFYFPQVADGTVANIRLRTTVILLNTSAEAANVTLEFFNSQGAPLALSLGDLGTNSKFDLVLTRGQSFSRQTPGTGNLQAGYARISVKGAAKIGGTAVFTQSDPVSGVILYEAGVPASSGLNSFTVIVDSTGNRDTGLALINPPSGGPAPAADTQVVATLYDQSFSKIATTEVPLETGKHLARFVWELFQPNQAVVEQAREMKGSLTVASQSPLAAVTLRQNDSPGLEFPDEVPTLTTFPVISGVADQPAPGAEAARMAGGIVQLDLDLSAQTAQVAGLLYRGFREDVLLGSAYLPLDSDRSHHRLLLDKLPGAQVDRLQLQLVYTEGKAGRALDLPVSSSAASGR